MISPNSEDSSILRMTNVDFSSPLRVVYSHTSPTLNFASTPSRKDASFLGRLPICAEAVLQPTRTVNIERANLSVFMERKSTLRRSFLGLTSFALAAPSNSFVIPFQRDQIGHTKAHFRWHFPKKLIAPTMPLSGPVSQVCARLSS